MGNRWEDTLLLAEKLAKLILTINQFVDVRL